MDLTHYANQLFGASSIPCFLVEPSNHNIVYLNNAMENLLPRGDSPLGLPYYNVFAHPVPADCLVASTEEYTCQQVVHSQTLGHDFTLIQTKVQCFEEYYLLCQYIESKNSDSLTFDQALTRCLALFQEDHQQLLPSMLHLLSLFYGATRSFIYRFDNIDTSIRLVAQWCSDPDYCLTEEIATKMNPQLLIRWFETAYQNDVVLGDIHHCHSGHNPIIYNILTTFDMKNLLLNPIFDGNGKVIGAVGLTDRDSTRTDYRLVKTVTHFISSELRETAKDETLTYFHKKDSLTGFFRRASYSQRLDQLCSEPPSSLGVVFVNVNGLKKVNTEFGNVAGDQYLKKASEIVSNHFKVDFYRIAGDEFVGFFPDISEEDLESSVKSLHQTLLQEEVTCFSFGHCWEKGRYLLDSMIQDAEVRMYINKQDYYSDIAQLSHDISDDTLSNLLKYLADEEFMIYLQPQFKLSDQSLYGAEALIRRFDKTNQKMVFPDQFISLYERKSIIRHVDLFVVEEVCRFLSTLQKEDKELPISVNLSRVTLQEYGIVDSIAEICDRYHIMRHLLIIEVTERVGLTENNVPSALISDFKAKGFHISLDDFGCAYSNIVTLAQIDVDEVKLDKSLIDDLATNPKNMILVRNVLRMCNELEDTSTLAEGIETENQAKLLTGLGCHLGQGYFYSRPIPLDDFYSQFIQKEKD